MLPKRHLIVATVSQNNYVRQPAVPLGVSIPQDLPATAGGVIE